MNRLTRAQVRRVDELAITRFGVPGVVLMENAALGVLGVARGMIPSVDARVVIVCGVGNNGGDGLAVARHLHNRGARVQIVLAGDPGRFRAEARVNFDIVQNMLTCPHFPYHPL